MSSTKGNDQTLEISDTTTTTAVGEEAAPAEVELTDTKTSTEDDVAPPPEDDSNNNESKDLEEGNTSFNNYSGDDNSESENEEEVSDTTSLRVKTRRDELEEVAEDHGNLIDKLFPRSPKAIGKRRYLMVICVGFLLMAILTFIFVSYYVVSVEPIHQLSNREIYQERNCLVLDQNLHHDVTVGLGSTWRGELRVQYNLTIGENTPQIATVHELVTGQLGFQTTALEFLRRPDHQIGKYFPCLVDVNMPYYAAPVAPTQVVAGSVIFSMTFIMIFDVRLLLLIVYIKDISLRGHCLPRLSLTLLNFTFVSPYFHLQGIGCIFYIPIVI